MSATFLWHDYETTGADPARDRPVQFAAIRTDAELNPIGEPIDVFCQPTPELLPQPEAVLVTRVTPQEARRRGLAEIEFCAEVHGALAEPGTCGVGYNSLRFDDSFTRNLLYRNFHDPYRREYANGNSRWDLIDLVRMCYALRPAGIEWPRREDGVASFKLDDLANANRLREGMAHEALSDVRATIALARLVRTKQRRLFDWYLGLRDKQTALKLLDWPKRTPVVHVSSKFPAARGHLSIVLPLGVLPDQANAIVAYDLAVDPRPLIELDVDAIRDRVFVASADLPEGEARIPLKLIRANRCPALAPLSVLKDVDHARIGLELDTCLAHAERLRGIDGLSIKAARVFERVGPDPDVDPELAIYQGFPSPADRAAINRVHGTPPDRLGGSHFRFADPKYHELLFRFRARNHPESLSRPERQRWTSFQQQCLWHGAGLASITLPDYLARIVALRLARAGNGADLALLDQLEAWGQELAMQFPEP